MVTIFEQGDIVYLDFDPQSGHEQKGRCPALVISNNLFNRVSSLTMVCPITHTDRGHPFHLRLDERTRTDGVILCDQARMLDPPCLLCGACSGGHLRRGSRYGHRFLGAEVVE